MYVCMNRRESTLRCFVILLQTLIQEITITHEHIYNLVHSGVDTDFFPTLKTQRLVRDIF